MLQLIHQWSARMPNHCLQHKHVLCKSVNWYHDSSSHAVAAVFVVVFVFVSRKHLPLYDRGGFRVLHNCTLQYRPSSQLVHANAVFKCQKRVKERYQNGTTLLNIIQTDRPNLFVLYICRTGIMFAIEPWQRVCSNAYIVIIFICCTYTLYEHILMCATVRTCIQVRCEHSIERIYRAFMRHHSRKAGRLQHCKLLYTIWWVNPCSPMAYPNICTTQCRSSVYAALHNFVLERIEQACSFFSLYFAELRFLLMVIIRSLRQVKRVLSTYRSMCMSIFVCTNVVMMMAFNNCVAAIRFVVGTSTGLHPVAVCDMWNKGSKTR